MTLFKIYFQLDIYQHLLKIIFSFLHTDISRINFLGEKIYPHSSYPLTELLNVLFKHIFLLKISYIMISK